jgi:transcriptional regulator with PAS, ATPase and Fis domain
MKPSEQKSVLSTDSLYWLTQFNQSELISSVLQLCDDFGLYILDKKHQVIFWSKGAETILGYKSTDFVGQPCIEELDIVEQATISRKLQNLNSVEGRKIAVQHVVQAMFDVRDEFAGGIGLLLPNWSLDDSTVQTAEQFNRGSKNFHGILSRSPQMEPVFQIIQNAAKTEATVLVRGESGSGKELVARAIHDLSLRRAAPFLAINCAALSINLLESELFGHVRGAFSGAIKDHAGLFQRAHGGTLFLDEVAELPQELQAKLLRVLQERNYTPVGGSKSFDVDVRIVAATHRSLRDQVKQGFFREDLMYRLRVVPIFIPALRERREDIPLLLWHFIKQHNIKGFRKVNAIDPSAMRLLLDYSWPGNIRELQNVMEYAFVVGHETTLLSSELPPEFREQPDNPGVELNIPELSAKDEKIAIIQALAQYNGKVSKAAKAIGMSRATFWRKRKLYEI